MSCSLRDPRIPSPKQPRPSLACGARRPLQRFAVILDHATSLTHRCFFRRPTRKITVPLKRGTPRSRPLGSTSLQPAVGSTPEKVPSKTFVNKGEERKAGYPREVRYPAYYRRR